MTPLAITFLVNIATSFFKNYVMPRTGKFGVHLILFMFALVATTFYHFDYFNDQIKNVLFTAGFIFSSAIVLYEVLLGYFPFFRSVDKGGDKHIED